MYFKYFSTDIVTIYQEPCIIFLHFLDQQINNYGKKKLKKFKTENVRKQFKKSQNIFNIVWCIGNANINIQ